MSEDRAERLARQIRSACGHYNNDDHPVVLCVTQMRGRILELKSKLAAAEADAERLFWLVRVDTGIDEIGDVDLHEQAAIYASAFCRVEPDKHDYIAAIRDAIDAARGTTHE